MRYAIRHVTRFKYEAPVRFARCNLRLRPVDWAGQRLEAAVIEVLPAARIVGTRPGGYLTNVTRIVVEKPAAELVIESRATLTVDRVAPVPAADDPAVAAIPSLARCTADLSAMSPANFLFPSPGIPIEPAIVGWCAAELRADRGVVEAALALARRIQADFRYDGSATEVETTPAEAFAARAGVCQDFAQIMISGLRGLGLPAAYVSGYLRTLPPPGKPRLVGADATHAWVLLWCGPALGWLGFDPTNGCTMGPDHIVAAIGRDYADVAPVDGVFIGRDGQEIDVSVDVAPVGEV